MSEEMSVEDAFGGGFKDLPSSGGAANKLPRADASYVLMVVGAELFPSTNPKTKGDPIFAANFEVVESSHPDVAIGARKTWSQNLNQRFGDKEYGKENVKQFVAAIAGLQPGSEEADAIDTPDVKLVIAGKANGATVRCDTVPKTSKAGNDWTLHLFAPHDEQDA